MMTNYLRKVRSIDSHTAGEPTRVILEGGPDLGTGPLAQRREIFRDRFDTFRSAVVNEPRGSDVLVGALLCAPVDPRCSAGVIFFNNVGCLNMCGHGTIGLVATLAFLGRMSPGEHHIETPVGIVTTWLHESGEITLQNVPSYRHAASVEIDVEGYGHMSGDIAWGGNWFFLVQDHGLEVRFQNLERLTDCTMKIRRDLSREKITGAGNQEIDHIELFGPPTVPGANSKNFVLCPGGAYDRSPCGTGTSAKLACLYADGKLTEGQIWRQESIIGSIFDGAVKVRDNSVYPLIKSTAYVTAECTLILDSRDPFNEGIRA